jgi:DNA-binding MarR family transcriptional regulator
MVKWSEVLKNVSPKTSQFKVLTYLAFKGASQPAKISTDTGIPAGTVRPALRTLLDKGYAEQHENGDYSSLVPFTDIVSHLYSVNKK